MTTRNRATTSWFCLEFPVTGYEKAWRLQKRLVAARRDGVIDRDVFLLLEHAPVFTLGRRGGGKHLRVSQDFLKGEGIQVVHVERGGEITYHGPGQLVAYPIMDLRASRRSVADYVEGLEEVMIRTARDWTIEAGRNPANRGVWVSGRKLGSLGIAIRRGISFHGLALNVNLSLRPFGWIDPCGLKGVQVTSMKRELSCSLSMSQIREAMKRHFQAVFGARLLMTTTEEMLPRLQALESQEKQDVCAL